jgi:hypothetical protein
MTFSLNTLIVTSLKRRRDFLRVRHRSGLPVSKHELLPMVAKKIVNHATEQEAENTIISTNSPRLMMVGRVVRGYGALYTRTHGGSDNHLCKETRTLLEKYGMSAITRRNLLCDLKPGFVLLKLKFVPVATEEEIDISKIGMNRKKK